MYLIYDLFPIENIKCFVDFWKKNVWKIPQKNNIQVFIIVAYIVSQNLKKNATKGQKNW